MAVDRDGSLYVNDLGNYRIRRIDGDGTITTVVGKGLTFSFSPDGTPAAEAGVGTSDEHFPIGLGFDAEGRLHFADLFFNRIRFIDANGSSRPRQGTESKGRRGTVAPPPRRVSIGRWISRSPPRGLFITTHDHGAAGGERVRAVDEDGSIATIAGTGEPGYSGDDGPAVDAELNVPAAVAVGPDGDLYIADANNNVIRKVEL